MTIQTALDNFILSRRLADLSPKTLSAYLQFCTPFVAFVSPTKALESITQGDITAYVSDLLKKPLSKSSRATYLRHLKIFLRWCQRSFQVQYNALEIKVPKSPKRSVKIYSDDEVMMLFESVETESEWLTARNKCILALMYDSGLRQSEVCNLEINKISFTDNRLTVHGKGDKERMVPLGLLTHKYMKLYMKLCPYKITNKLFMTRRGSPLSCNAVKLLVSRIADSLPFEVSSHKLRHNFATNYCLDQYERYGQIDIYRLMYLMGHEELETTKRYLHLAYEIISSRGCISHLDGIMKAEI